MKQLLYGALLYFAFSSAFGQSIWDVSPLSPDNSPLKWENSPHNWDNSIVGSQSGLYNGAGRQIGYATTTPSGATNVYLNNGHRIGYVPAVEDTPLRYDSLPGAESMPAVGPGLLDAPLGQGRQERRGRILDDDYYPPPRQVSAPVKSGFTPLAPTVRTGFTPIDQATPVRAGFIPLSGFTPLR